MLVRGGGAGADGGEGAGTGVGSRSGAYGTAVRAVVRLPVIDLNLPFTHTS